MLSKTLMIQGTASHVGKSLIVAGLCRVFKNRGVAVAPFKSQNMALNSYATKDGLEMGRAQAVQAMAAGLVPTVTMNPILLKPTSERNAQIIVEGRAIGSMDALTYHGKKREMMGVVESAIDKLRRNYELLLIEGAGSPAEVNLADQDIANMAVARAAMAPVILVADIDRGGAFASICGTLDLLPPLDRRRVKGLIINKFRGDISLLKSGLQFLREKTGVPVVGVIPYANFELEEEDSVALEARPERVTAKLRIAVPLFPRISNFTDLHPFETIDEVHVDYIRTKNQLGEPDAIILPGSKNTISDLGWLRQTGLADEIKRLVGRGTPVFGICGGYQMLGEEIVDSCGVEGLAGRMATGLGLLPVNTCLKPAKKVCQASAKLTGGQIVFGNDVTGQRVGGYEIHTGETKSVGAGAPFAELAGGALDGWAAADQPVVGTYLHGIFDNRELRNSFLKKILAQKNLDGTDIQGRSFEDRIETIASVLEQALDIELIDEIVNDYVCAKEGLVVN